MPPTDLASLLEEHRDKIVASFVAEVQRKHLSPAGLSRSLLVDHIPKFLDELIVEIRRGQTVRFSHDALDVSETARQHGEQRWGLGYDLTALIREYGVLRHAILQTAKQEGMSLSIDEFDVLAKCLSVGVAEAASECIRHRDEQLGRERAKLEFLAEAGRLLSSSLDYRSTLSRLTDLVVPRLGDWCAVHVEGASPDDLPIAHVDPAKVEVLREIYRRFPLPADSPHGYPRVLRTGEAELVPAIAPGFLESAAQSEEHLALLRRVDSCSWMIAPLQIGEHILGAVTIVSSDSGRRYGPADLVLATALASRAAIAIDNARLYALSQQERSRVEAATRAKDEFVAVVSHELRTPLNAIVGWSRLLREGSLPEEKQKHAMEVIERNATAQNHLVADLLDISRVMTGSIRVTPSQVDLADVVEMAIEGVRPAADAKRIAIVWELHDDSALMRGDAERLRQVVWNLLTNAVKFTPKGGHVTVRLQRADSDLELVVEDDGQGIDAAFLPHVFETFRQSDAGPTRHHGGLGIGLSIAKHIVELHGGSIEARSAGPARGATFVVRLPISPLVSTTLGVGRVPATRSSDAPVRIPTGMDGLSVLVVDDEPDARDLVAHVLEASGMEVRVAASAADALAELESFSPHVVVSDIGMPHEDGYSLIRAIRTLGSEKRNVAAIALSAFGRNEDRTAALVAGFNKHMAKPVEPAALVRGVVDLAGHVQRR